MSCAHEWKYIDEGLKFCPKCGTLQIGNRTIRITPDYIEFSGVSSSPSLPSSGLRLYAKTDGKLYYATPSGEKLLGSNIVSMNISGTSSTVTETTETLKSEISPDVGSDILYVEGIHIQANNPSGSGVTLTFSIKAVLDDASEISIVSQNVSEGGSFDDWLRWIYDSIPSGKKIRSIRLYAYCSATPTSGYEPTVQIVKVTGLQG